MLNHKIKDFFNEIRILLEFYHEEKKKTSDAQMTLKFFYYFDVF